MRSILFITWDGPQTNYLESLFFPIFNEVALREDYDFHVLQFTWANDETISRIKTAAMQHKCHYTPVVVNRKAQSALRWIRTILTGSRQITKYISDHKIDVIMPRSTMPALMVGLAARRLRGIKTIFDADGFPNQERVDFMGRKKGGLIHLLRERAETHMLKTADVVLVRTVRAIDIHLRIIGERFRDKFYVVANGRDPQLFQPRPAVRQEVRQRLGLANETTLFVYCGSLGPQYLPDEMMAVFAGYKRYFADATFLVLTGDGSEMEKLVPPDLRGDVMIKHVPFSQIPDWLNAGDIAFSLRRPAFSMAGVAPIKLGEYMMAGLPTLASKGIGDTEEILLRAPGTFLYDYADPDRIGKAVEWCRGLTADRAVIRDFGVKHFSLEQSVADYIDALK